jgi:hypothetical protein
MEEYDNFLKFYQHALSENKGIRERMYVNFAAKGTVKIRLLSQRANCFSQCLKNKF